MADYKVTDIELTYLADRIRAKGNTSSPIEWTEGKGFGNAVDAISGGGSTSVLHGTDNPSPSLGNNGDIYLLHNSPSDQIQLDLSD